MLRPQFRFGALTGVMSASYTLARGVSPSICSVTVPPSVQLDRRPHTMVWSDGVRTLQFSNCLVVDVNVTQGQDGKQSLVVSIADRRWRWSLAQISGQYNVITGGRIIEGTRRSARQLAALCLDALGEEDYDLRQMPDDVYPPVDWDVERVDSALDELCRSVGSHVVLRHDDRVAIYFEGRGMGLPALPSSSEGVSYDFGAIPGHVAIVSAPMQWQLDFDLVPVGLDVDNKIKPIDALSYRPPRGWEYEDFPDCTNVDIRVRRLARETVWRWYRVIPPGWEVRDLGRGRTFDEPGYRGLRFMPGGRLLRNRLPIYAPSQLVLLTSQLDTEQFSGTQRAEVNAAAFDPEALSRKRAQVWGIFTLGNGAGEPNEPDDEELEELQLRTVDLSPELVVPTSFEIDSELMLVKFSDAVYLEEGSQVVPPRIKLRTACQYRDSETRAAYRLVKKYPVPQGMDDSLVEYHALNDVVPELRPFLDEAVPAVSNVKEVEKELDRASVWQLVKYRIKTPGNAVYPMLVPASPDGIIAQVSIDIDQAGYMSTSVHREAEDASNFVSYDERRDQLRVLATVRKIAVAAVNQDAVLGGKQ
jgi:hypothetical protein